jgi:hypothetical protein
MFPHGASFPRIGGNPQAKLRYRPVQGSWRCGKSTEAATPLVPRACAWHGDRAKKCIKAESMMAQRGGGFLITIALLVGAVVGTIYGEPSIGLVAGLGVGVFGAVLVWLYDRARSR